MTAPISKRTQSGMMLLEALIAILIFAVGILGIVGLQATSIKQGTDARYRSEAAMLANQYIGQMWLTSGASAVLADKFSDGGANNAAYTTWAAAVGNTLPVPAAYPPAVSVNSVAGDPGEGTVTITIQWRPPSEPDTVDPHKYVVIAQIKPSL